MWDPAFKAAVLDHLFRQAATPRQDSYYLRLRTAGGEIDDAVWTNYERLELDATTAETIFAAAAAIEAGDGRRSANSGTLTFSAAAAVTGTAPVANGWDLMSAAEGGSVLVGGDMPDKPITDGDPVTIAAGLLRIDLAEPAA